MANDWREYKLGDVINLKRGYDLPQRDRVEGNIPIVTSSGVTGYHNVAKAKGPGVVTGRYGTLGEIFYVKEDYWPHNTALYVQDFKGNDPLFISYFLRTLHFSAQNVAGAVPGVNRNYLHLMPVRVPSLPIQRKIAAVLSAYDDLIEVNTRRIRLLEEIAQAVYRQWFGSVDVASLPEGWRFEKLGDVVELAYGKGLKKGDRAGGNIPVYGSSGIVGYHGEALVEGPGIIVGRKGNIGSVFWSDGDFYPIDTTYFVRTELSLYYVFYNLQFQNFLNNDAAVPGLSRNQANLLPFLVPPKSMQDKFDEFASPVFQQLKNLAEKIANLRQTRDLLLPRLVSGEVGVK